MRRNVTMNQTARNEAVLTIKLADGRNVTLPVRLIEDDLSPAGIWTDGRLTQFVPAAKGLALAIADRAVSSSVHA